MNFLKKLGAALANAAAIAAGIGPLIAPFVGAKAAPVLAAGINDLTQISATITSAQALITTPGSGAQKLAAVTPLVLQILKTSEAFGGMKIADETLAAKGAQEVAQGVVDFMSAIHPDAVKTAA